MIAFVIGIAIAVIVVAAICIWVTRKPKGYAVPAEMVLKRKNRPRAVIDLADVEVPKRRYNQSPYAGKTIDRSQETDPLLSANAALLYAAASSDARPSPDHSSVDSSHATGIAGGGFSSGESFGGGGFTTGEGFGGGSDSGSIGGND